MTGGFTDDDLREVLPRLRRFALSLTHDVANADDLVQSCMERALSRAGGRRADGDLRAWLFSILYRCFLDSQRRGKRYTRILDFFSGAPEPVAPSAEDVALARAALGDLARLSTDQQSLLLLVSVEGLGYQEAADVLNIPIGTVMSRLSRARKALRDITEGHVAAKPALRLMK